MTRFPPKRILVGVDLSKQAAEAWLMAQDWAKRFGATLKAVHAAAAPPIEFPMGIPGPSGLSGRSGRRALAAELRRHIGASGIEVLEGNPVVTLLRVARTWNADLIVIGTHGRQGLERVLLGSVAEALVRRSKVPVLTVWSKVPVRSVLAPVNFTPYSDHAFAVAASTAAALGASLTAQHAYEAEGGPAAERGARAAARLRRMAGLLPAKVRQACRPKTLLSRGRALDAILAAAREHDLIVLAAHRRGLLHDAVLGTTAEQALRLSAMPVLAVPAPAPKAFAEDAREGRRAFVP